MLKLKLKRHHTAALVLVTIAIIAWAVWSFILLPMSETPNLPVPSTPVRTDSSAPLNQ